MSVSAHLADDARARREALDPTQSFIVQAPAGSGKTELLIQRYLRLLACVTEPEEVLAITFTRKAAGEMRGRVIQALRQAAAEEPPADPYLRHAYDLAVAVLGDERRRHWGLHRHPARLGISTIDAVNAWLAGRAPLTAGNASLHQVTDRPQRLYREAARATLEMLGEDGEPAQRVAALLAHLDNSAERFERLVALMLPRREQWLRHIPRVDRRTRPALEAPLVELCEGLLRRLSDLLQPAMRPELAALLVAAADRLAAGQPESPLLAWRGCEVFPEAVAGELPRWRALAGALLTRGGEWRRRFTREQGFPPGSPAKVQMLALLARCEETPGLREALDDVQALPGPAYGDGQWDVLCALLDVLPLAAAQLRLIFVARGLTDFAEVAADALDALGAGDRPSELGLALDHRIRHLLVDEFQDTSSAQFDLLAQLLAGWQPDDGRTLFLVGDPMQSIYRFREAEVRLFMNVRDHGLGGVRPRFLQLQANFRSDPRLVAWVNEHFSATFPAADDATLGAVRFARGEPALAPDPDATVGLHWAADADVAVEGRAVAAVVADCRRRWPDETVGVLVRSRAHAAGLIAALRARGIAFMAPDLEVLERSPVAQDLLALTRALLHPADRLAWLALLRAPWCGLSLVDLVRLAGRHHERAVWALMNDVDLCATLSADGQGRLERLRARLADALALRGRLGLRDLVEGAWLALGGPATMGDAGELHAVDAFFEQLDAVDEGGDCADPEALAEDLATRQATLAGGNPLVQIMTVHKAKGLQFDTVMLPGLSRVPRRDDRPMLLWHEVSLGDGGSASVLAPVNPTAGGQQPLYEFLWRIEQQKQASEQDRLLYVACTRAKRRLHLFASVSGKSDARGRITVAAPRRGSLLARLWPAVQPAAQRWMIGSGVAPEARSNGREPQWVEPRIRRLRTGWTAPSPPAAWRLPGAALAPAGEVPEYEWANRWAMHAGAVAHQWLQRIATEGVERYDERRIDELEPVLRRMLTRLGVAGRELEEATARVRRALTLAVSGPGGRWVLSAQHAAAASELPLTTWDGAVFRQLVIDRTFVDRDGSRWIIDYKTSAHEGGDLEAFLRAEVERHRQQLCRYRQAMRLLAAEPIRVALYFPLLEALREVPLD